MIPEGWQEKEIGEVATLQRGFDLPEQNRIFGIYPIISSSGVTGFHNTFKVSPPGVVTGRYGTIGEVFFVDTDFWPLNTSLWVKDFHGNSHRYVYYLLKSIDYKKLSDKTGVPGINRNDVHKIRVVLPPLPEQCKIAEILSTWDKAIALLEQLITAKRKLKQGLMQQLLTGKKRFKEFEGSEWNQKTLGEVVEKIVGGGTPSRDNPDFWGDEIPWVTVKDFATFNPYKTQEFITKEGLINSSSNLIPKGTVIIPTRMALGKSAIYKVDVSINQDLKAIFPKRDIDNIYLYYWIQNQAEHIDKISSGSTVKGIVLTDLKKIGFLKPSLPEQEKIASILSAADAEISNLEKQLAAYKQQKRGLMQQLLTGKKRVKLDEPQMQKV